MDTLETDGHLDLLYCHPAHAGKGLASRLLGMIETDARKLALPRLYTEARGLALPVFARADFNMIARRDFQIGGVSLHNYGIEKRL